MSTQEQILELGRRWARAEVGGDTVIAVGVHDQRAAYLTNHKDREH